MYVVEYRRFYLRDIESIVIWPSRSWLFRLIIPGVLLAALGASLWKWTNATAGQIFVGIGLAWILLELALGPTANARIQATGVNVELPLVRRTRRARKVLAAIDAAARAFRDVPVQPAVSVPSVPLTGASVQTNSEAPSATPSIADASQTIGF
jgi:hypothetical protein